MKAVTSYTVVIPAAGIGSRMQTSIPKQYLSIAGKTVIEHSISALLSHPRINKVMVVLHPNDENFSKLDCANNPQVLICQGGEERVDSVLKGLHACMKSSAVTETDWVLVHDAARPCISLKEIDALLAIREHSVGGILATPVSDTIKLAADSSSEESAPQVQRTVDRTGLWQAQTPQFFPINDLIHAIEQAQQNTIQITDEASAMESVGATVKLVEGRSSNIKITRPSDLSLAEFYLNLNDKQGGN